jgi:ElaB/YqjD/DUF883 family membrane-anchored ribosome-binding protein
LAATSEATVLRSGPDLALPEETQSSMNQSSVNMDEIREKACENPGAAIATAAGAGLLLGIAFKKILPAKRRS